MAASTYGSIERGETDVNLSRPQQIAKIFEMDLLNLVAWDKGTTFNFMRYLLKLNLPFKYRHCFDMRGVWKHVHDSNLS